MPPLVAILGGAGAIPFVVGAMLVWLSPPNLDPAPVRVVIVYGATILSFLGGISWGVASGVLVHDPFDQDHPLLFSVSVVPSLVAWVAVFLPDRIGLTVLALSFASILWLDHRLAVARLVPTWWLGLRRRLSLLAIISLIAAAAAPLA